MRTKHNIEVGSQFGKLTVVGLSPNRYVGKDGKSRKKFLVQCDCGSTPKPITGNNLVTTKSCGCLMADVGIRNRTHGMRYTPEWHAWQSMKGRCFDASNPAFPNYGGRGITICAEWLRDPTAFFKHIGLRPSPLHSIDRWPDNDGNYEPGNVRWATKFQQTNNRRVTILVTAFGETLPLSEWATRAGLNYYTLWSRLFERGWPAERSLTTALSTPMFTAYGKTLTISEWSAATGIKHDTIGSRIRRGWSVERAVTP